MLLTLITKRLLSKAQPHNGLTNPIIDAITGATDPKIMVYSGGFAKKPSDWTNTNYLKNGNNHSLVIKVLFGKANFIFSGDLETEGIEKVLSWYANTTALQADVIQVGHHEAENSTTPD